MAIITITRGVQSGGRELARLLAGRLGYSCLSREVITNCSRKYNTPEQDLYDKLMEAPSRWQKFSKNHFRYLIYIQCSLIEAARHDNVIYHGYAGQLFLRGVRHALKIRLSAPMEDRVQAEMREYGKDHDEALNYIRTADEQRNRWVEFLYGTDWHDPSFYDLSISLQNMSLDNVCDIVALLVESREFRTTEKSLMGLNNLSLECEVKAAISSDDKIWDHPVSVSASGSVVTLRGMVKNRKVKDAIVDVASKVKGVTDCKVYINLPEDPLSKGIYGHD